MATSSDFEVEGVTAFAAPPAPDYRYVISVKDGKVNIWMEDRFSKKQWQSGFLSKEDFVTPANAFVDASVADYVSCFQQSLDYKLDESADAQRKLAPLLKGKLFLKLSVKIRMLQSARDVSYTFELLPIAVERIDILESKMKDQQQELEKLRCKVGSTNLAHVYVESKAMNSSQFLTWEQVHSDYFRLTADKAAIEVLLQGCYSVGVIVNHMPNGSNTTATVMLQKDGVEIQRACSGSGYDSYNGRYTTHQTSSTLVCLTRMEIGEKLAVVFTGTTPVSNWSSYLTATRIGD
ncbi:hypothetical protein BBJ28_00016801 [Nothophytophthora sp. Chile5]|nr:hypothetical protein BBJ28_00016801 [Nothophytophthora sp. Chile5]